jgi:hypothetical protein
MAMFTKGYISPHERVSMMRRCISRKINFIKGLAAWTGDCCQPGLDLAEALAYLV